MMYTSHQLKVKSCDAEECVMMEVSNMDSRMIYCDAEICDRWIHVYCDPKVRKLRKLPERYYCPFCSGGRKKKGAASIN